MFMKRIAVAAAALMLSAVTAFADYGSDLDAMVAANWRDDYMSAIYCKIGSTGITVGDDTAELTSAPMLYDGNTLIAIRDIAGYYGFAYSEDGYNFTLTQGTLTAAGRLGSDVITVTADGETSQVTLPCPAMRYNGTIRVPLRAAVEDVFAGTVAWNGEKQEIILLREYQSRRIIVRVTGSTDSVDALAAKQKITDGDGVWIVQFDPDTPDLVIKRICESLETDTENIEYAIPDVIMG